jgi:hypothetical protein
MTGTQSGGCVCGSVRYVVDGEPERVTVCHCTWCQRRTGSAFGVEVVFRAQAVAMVGEAPSTYRHVSDRSGRWLDQDFCPRCGSNIGFTLEAVPGIRTIAAGTFDDPGWIRRDQHRFRYVFLRSARDWSRPPDGAETHEEHFRP